MRILQICHKPPLPATDGGCLAMHTLTEGLLELGHEVKVLTLCTHKHPFEPEKMSDAYLHQTAIEGVFVDTRINLVDAFSSFMTSDSYNVSRFFSPDFDRKLTQVLTDRSFDAVLLESLFVTPYIVTIRRLSRAPVVFRSHNLEYFIWNRLASATSNLARKTYLRYLAAKLKEYELKILESVDAVAAISAEDTRRYKRLGVKKPMLTLPFGVNLDKYPVNRTQSRPKKLFHLGSMDWSPNTEGVIWFLETIWPEIHANHPELELHLAGRQMPEYLLESSYPGVSVKGEVEDATQYMTEGDIMVVPLLSAGGIRVKIIEGMALGKAVISTAIGAEGIPFQRNVDLVIASNARQFSEGIEFLLSEENYKDICKNARTLAEQEFDNKKLVIRLSDFLEKLRKK